MTNDAVEKSNLLLKFIDGLMLAELLAVKMLLKDDGQSAVKN